MGNGFTGIKFYYVVEPHQQSLAVTIEFHESIQTGHGVDNRRELLPGLFIIAGDLIDHGLITHD